MPTNTTSREDGWKAFRLQGTFEFTLVGILSGVLKILAENNIGIFAVSTFNTDYIFVKKENFEMALHALEKAGYVVE